MKALDPLPELVELMERSARASIAYAKADTERLAACERFRAERLKADVTQQTGQQNSPGEQP